MSFVEKVSLSQRVLWSTLLNIRTILNIACYRIDTILTLNAMTLLKMGCCGTPNLPKSGVLPNTSLQMGV